MNDVVAVGATFDFFCASCCCSQAETTVCVRGAVA